MRNKENKGILDLIWTQIDLIITVRKTNFYKDEMTQLKERDSEGC